MTLSTPTPSETATTRSSSWSGSWGQMTRVDDMTVDLSSDLECHDLDLNHVPSLASFDPLLDHGGRRRCGREAKDSDRAGDFVRGVGGFIRRRSISTGDIQVAQDEVDVMAEPDPSIGPKALKPGNVELVEVVVGTFTQRWLPRRRLMHRGSGELVLVRPSATGDVR